MATSGITLVGSISSLSDRSSPPSSPSLSKPVNIEVPKVNGNGVEVSNAKPPSNSSKSYADMLRPTIVPVKNGVEKSDTKHKASLSLRAPVAWRYKSVSLEKT